MRPTLVPLFVAVWLASPSDAFATFSIVARDPISGAFGVAVHSHFFAVGRIVPWASPGIGAVATQAFADAGYGPKALALLRGGKGAQLALEQLVKVDGARDSRQVAVVDRNGNVAVHTGTANIPHKGHLIGKGYSVQGNMLGAPSVLPAMAKAFEDSRAPFAGRLLAALDAAQRAGGDYRGKQSAAILVVSGSAHEEFWNHVQLDLRVDDAVEPLVELNRLYRVARAYSRVFAAGHMVAKREFAAALVAASDVFGMPDANDEVRLLATMVEASAGSVDLAAKHAREILARSPQLRPNLLHMPTKRFPGLPALRKLLGIADGYP